MAPQTPGGGPSSASASNAKKKTTEKAARNNSMVETRRAAALNLLLGKEKEDFMQGADQTQEGKPAHQKKKVGKSVIQKKDQKEIARDDSEEEAGNEGLFLTPQRGNTPRLEDNGHPVKPPSAPLFTAPASAIPVPSFPIFTPSDQNELSSQRQNPNLKRRADPLGGSPIRKTARVLSGKTEVDAQMGEILDMLYTLSATVEKQNQEIAELKELVKKSIAVETATPGVQPKGKETMASRLALSLLNPAPLADKSSSSTSSKPRVAPSVNTRSGPHITLDISGCDISLKERGFAEIRKHFQSCLQSHEETKTVIMKGMNKDAKKDHRYFLFFHTEEDEKAARIHTGKWLLSAFPRAFIQTATTYRVKVNNVRADVIVDPMTNKVTDHACQLLAQSSGHAISRIGWLSGPGKKYGSMVVHFIEEKDADAVLARGLLEVGGESACTGLWIEKEGERRCFNCQQYGHISPYCKNEKICGNCAGPGHTHRECMNTQQKCSNCEEQHRANNNRCPIFSYRNENRSSLILNHIRSPFPFSLSQTTSNE